VKVSTRPNEGSRVCLPGLLVEIHGQEPACFIQEEWVNSDSVLTEQMIPNYFIRQRKAFAIARI
jgi:hypothetical protein